MNKKEFYEKSVYSIICLLSFVYFTGALLTLVAVCSGCYLYFFDTIIAGQVPLLIGQVAFFVGRLLVCVLEIKKSDKSKRIKHIAPAVFCFLCIVFIVAVLTFSAVSYSRERKDEFNIVIKNSDGTEVLLSESIMGNSGSAEECRIIVYRKRLFLIKKIDHLFDGSFKNKRVIKNGLYECTYSSETAEFTLKLNTGGTRKNLDNEYSEKKYWEIVYDLK